MQEITAQELLTFFFSVGVLLYLWIQWPQSAGRVVMAVASVGGSNLVKTKILAKHNTVNEVDRLHSGTKPAHAVQG
jgi:hypothetical protein